MLVGRLGVRRYLRARRRRAQMMAARELADLGKGNSSNSNNSNSNNINATTNNDNNSNDNRKGTNRVSTNGVTANLTSFDRGTFWGTPVNLLLSSQKCQGVPLSPICQNQLLLQRPHSVLTPFVRNHRPHALPSRLLRHLFCISCHLSKHVKTY